MILGSKQHTTGNTTRWRIDYSRWLDNTATIESADITSPSDLLTVDNLTVLGREVVFFLSGGELNKTVTLSVQMTDSLGNVKYDTILFTVVAP